MTLLSFGTKYEPIKNINNTVLILLRVAFFTLLQPGVIDCHLGIGNYDVINACANIKMAGFVI